MQQFVDVLLNGPARYTLAHHFNAWLTLGIVLGALLIEFGAVYALVWLLVKAGQQARHIVQLFTMSFGNLLKQAMKHIGQCRSHSTKEMASLL